MGNPPEYQGLCCASLGNGVEAAGQPVGCGGEGDQTQSAGLVYPDLAQPCKTFLTLLRAPARPGNNSRLSGNQAKCQNIFCNGTEHVHTKLI